MSSSTNVTAPEISPPKSKEIWNTMPGWGIVANLTPIELIVARRIQSVRKYLLVALLALVLVLGALYGWAWSKSKAATSDLTAERGRTLILDTQQSKYGSVTTLQGSIDQITTQISQLMSADVDMSSTIQSLRTALPAKDTLSSVSVTISKASVAVGQSAAAAPTNSSSLNTTGHQIIGTITLSGKGASIDSVATYVSALRKISGVTDVVPTANSGAAGAFNISLSLTDVLLSHHFDGTTQGGSK